MALLSALARNRRGAAKGRPRVVAIAGEVIAVLSLLRRVEGTFSLGDFANFGGW